MGSEGIDLRDFGFVPGYCLNTCSACYQQFVGAKRCFTCEPCALDAHWEWHGLTPRQQAERKARNLQRAHDAFHSFVMIDGMSKAGRAATRAALPQEDGR